jgi:3-oxoacyl-[acyl-carrier-protein] synthase-3
MYMYTPGHSRPISTGAYIPERCIRSRDILQEIDSERRFGIPHDWLDRVMGIRERRAVPEDMPPSDMATHAAREALELAGLRPTELDAIIYAGVDRDYLLEPATAHVVQDKLGAHHAIAFDVTNACHGFMNGIHLMDALIATGQARRGLVVTGERGYRYIRKAMDQLARSDDRELFLKLAGGLTLGDAGAAMIMGPKLGPESGFMGFMLQSQGQYSPLCTCGGDGRDSALETDMAAILAQGHRLLGAMYRETLAKLKWSPADIAKFVCHQVGRKGFKLHADYAQVALDAIPNTVATLGNVVTATIPLNLHRLRLEKSLAPGDKVFISGIGSGISLSQAGLVWEAA